MTKHTHTLWPMGGKTLAFNLNIKMCKNSKF
jgi:hypothetical protein